MVRNITNGYGRVHISVLSDPKLSMGSKGLYGYLCSYENDIDRVYPNISQISNDLGCVRRTVVKYIKELEQTGIVIRNSNGRIIEIAEK